MEIQENEQASACVLNPFSFKIVNSRLTEQEYTQRANLGAIFSDIFKSFLGASDAEKDTFFESKLPELLSGELPIIRNYATISLTFASRFLFLETLKTIFDLNIKEISAIEFFQFVQLLSNDFPPQLFKKLLVLIDFRNAKNDEISKCESEYWVAALSEHLLAKKHNFKGLRNLFTKFFFLLELTDTLEAIFQNNKILKLNEVSKEFLSELQKRKWLLPIAHLLWRASANLARHKIKKIVVFRPEFLAKISWTNQVSLLDILNQILFEMEETDSLVEAYTLIVKREREDVDRWFNKVVNEESNEEDNKE